MRRLWLVLLLAACSSGGPVIDDLQMPATAGQGADGLYHVRGLITFHDPLGVVNKIRISIPAVQGTYEFTAGDGGLSRGTLPIEVDFSSLTPKGAIDYDVSLVDAGGMAGDARKLSVTLD
jgi:hypothetical protein